MVARPYPSLKGAQYESVRRKKDPRTLDIVRRLEDSYYGTALTWDKEGHAVTRAQDGWKHGVSHPFVSGAFSYDVQSTLKESKALFDNLHGLCWQKHLVAVVDQNVADGNPYPDMDLEETEQELPRRPGDGPDEVRYRRVRISKKKEAQKQITDLRIKGIEIEDI